MKKIIALIMTLAIATIILTGCGGSTQNPPPIPGTTGNTTTETTTGSALKTGLAVISSIEKSTDAAEKEGLAQVDSTVVAVTVDGSGKIADCVIDAAQTKINFSKDGKITTPLDKAFKTKQELGPEYGMAKASSIKKEWNEQVDAFAEYVKGKTVSEVKGIAVNAEGVPTAGELTSSVTVHVGDFIAAIEKAVNNAQDKGAKAGDKLGLGIVTTISKSTDATAEKEGLAQAYSAYSASTFGTDGKVTSCVIDASQSNVNFDAAGKITTDLKAAALKTKNELGDAYGMRKASSIKKEWFEQAAAFADYVKGKTVNDVKGIAVSAEGVPTQAELTGSVTVHIGDFLTIIEKASADAK